MSSRPGWTLMVLALCGCGELPEPGWLLTEEPRVLAFRTEVVEPGPLSHGFLPIPADRVRSQPLPGDTIEISTWVVVAEREVPTHEVDPAWFMCPRSAPCVRALTVPGAGEPCQGVVPDRVACRLPDEERPRFVAPPLDPQTPLEDQTFFRVAMVGHVGDELSTADCVELVSDRSAQDWSGCLVAYELVALGPKLRLLTHAIEAGIEVPEGLEGWTGTPAPPPYNPEVVPLRMVPYRGPREVDRSRIISVAPGDTAVLDAGMVYWPDGALDPKDIQTVAELTNSTLSTETSYPNASFFSSVPGVVEFSRETGWQIWTPEEPGSFDLRVVLGDRAGGAAWGTFHFEVAAP